MKVRRIVFHMKCNQCCSLELLVFRRLRKLGLSVYGPIYQASLFYLSGVKISVSFQSLKVEIESEQTDNSNIFDPVAWHDSQLCSRIDPQQTVYQNVWNIHSVL